MARLAALYAILWGIGLSMDPRLLEYKWFGVAGMGLILGGMLFIDKDIRFPWEWDDIGFAGVFKRYSHMLILLICLLIGLAFAALLMLRPELFERTT